MLIKTFEAVDMKQALDLVRSEMGADAVIVSSRSVTRDGGLFGLLGRKVLEVTAAATEPKGRDGGEVEGPGSAGSSRARGSRRGVYHEIRAVKQAVDPVMDELRAIRQTVSTLDERITAEPADLQSDVAQIRTMLASLVGTGSLGPDVDGAAAQRLFYFLVARGIDDPLARSLVQRVIARVESGALGDLDRLKLNLAAEMRADLGRVVRGGAPSRIQVFVGPTGAGKTTTIAKLAARASESAPGNVLIITTDVHRIAAVEQMIRFGEILDIDVEVAISPEDLARTVAKAANRDRIFIDTAGRSHRDPSTIRGLRQTLGVLEDLEIMLVLSATTRAADSREILSAYSAIPCSRLIMTKLDETRIFGELYNCSVRSGRPIACVTTGQSVPQHLESLDLPGILRKILHGQGDRADA